jgi:uracil-DNA glycosylase
LYGKVIHTPETKTEQETGCNKDPDRSVGLGGDGTADICVVAGDPGTDRVGNYGSC